jgi:hypothetical protein
MVWPYSTHGEMTNAYSILLCKHETENHLRELGERWEDIIKLDFKVTGHRL